jgi:hypothetical protein
MGIFEATRHHLCATGKYLPGDEHSDCVHDSYPLGLRDKSEVEWNDNITFK